MLKRIAATAVVSLVNIFCVESLQDLSRTLPDMIGTGGAKTCPSLVVVESEKKYPFYQDSKFVGTVCMSVLLNLLTTP